ncbi:7-carboxy-7-deazaguanine synthase QueE [Campylobacter sp. faydin G-140]|uniref:7-carboxy-7-deazaguanine synthase QueE n=1 Tax=Campylobacter anatolicus TaxID=2829105 RepID=UPI001BA2E34C|nr:7-carboxy-7-deazaguanine synthase QueE [Campylobacter anatolicus]MBR8465475.1 7-carboxy-7-deazaguanine synthase QueE [Campylobacter anatolicus]
MGLNLKDQKAYVDDGLKLPLVESFLSIQGEGKYSGHLAIFLRFAGCNLNCIGFNVKANSLKTGESLVGCDTIRAVFTSHFDAHNLNVGEILSLVSSFADGLAQKPIIVITGGEPLVHHKKPAFLNLIQNLLKLNYEVHFESNGTIFIDFSEFEIYKNCHFALGVKLANSGVSFEKRINEKAIKAIKDNAKDSFYKFVLSGENDELEQILQVLKIAINDVWCMPMGADNTQLNANALRVAEFAIKNGFNYSDRTHIRLWDKKEGV